MAGEGQTTGQGTGGDGGQGAGGSQQGQQGGKTFTQEQLDAIIADRLGRERDKYKDYEQLKTKVKELENDNLSEAERLQRTAADNEKRAAEAEGRIAQSEVRADFTEKALAAGVTDVKRFTPTRVWNVGAGFKPAVTEPVHPHACGM